MAKRKSLNKRLSRYSNRSTVSAILDNDTNDLGEERPLWWRDLDNNTVRPSTNSYLMNETSRNLSCGSQLTSEVQEGWWKDLEQSNKSVGAKDNAENTKTGETQNKILTSTSDSDGEPRIRKRKLPLCRRVRKSKGNAFLNILNSSKSSIASERLGQSTRENSVNKLVSTENLQTQLDGHKNISINHSGNTDIVVKTKPRILLRGLSDKGENAFDNVLNTDIQDSLSNGKSSVSTPIVVNNVTKSPVLYQRRQSRFTLSFENEQDVSHFPIPKAQSTVLESNVSALRTSSKAFNTSDSETEVSKGQSRSSKRMCKSVGRNFENVLVQAGTNSEVPSDDIGTVASDISLTASTEGSEKIPPAALENEGIQTVLKSKSNIEEDKSNVEEENHMLRSSQMKNKSVTQLAPRSEKSIEGHNLMVEGNDTSEDTSDTAPTQSPKETNTRIADVKSSKGQQSIRDFFNATSSVPASQALSNVEMLNKIRQELEEIKVQEMASMKKRAEAIKAKQHSTETNIIKSTRKKKLTEAAKPINKAYLVNGKVYKVPRLPRPKYWVTDRLYKYLWKRMEPKFDLETRVQSEKFVQQLSDVMSFITKRKTYANYKSELHSLMKKMARLGIIHTRKDFYHFCQDFLPYELRVKTIPMLLPGDTSDVPFNPEKLNEPLLTP